jgi:hypothetical protein
VLRGQSQALRHRLAPICQGPAATDRGVNIVLHWWLDPYFSRYPLSSFLHRDVKSHLPGKSRERWRECYQDGFKSAVMQNGIPSCACLQNFSAKRRIGINAYLHHVMQEVVFFLITHTHILSQVLIISNLPLNIQIAGNQSSCLFSYELQSHESYSV